MHDHFDEDYNNTTLECFRLYVKGQKIQIHRSIRPHHFPTHGLGIYTTDKIEV
jgi:hypothetical protein